MTGHILHVLFADSVKQLKKIPGVWPPEFDGNVSAIDAANKAAEEELEQLSIENSTSADISREQPSDAGADPLPKAQLLSFENGDKIDESSEESSSDDDLPPIVRIQNRRVIQYEISESESDDE